MKLAKFSVSFFSTLALLVFFQNCGSSLDYNEYGVGESSSLSLQAPAISVFPVNHSLSAGATLTLQAETTGQRLSYQWFKNGAILSNATGKVFAIPAALASDSGTYTLRVSNAAGVAERSVQVTVSAGSAPPPTSGSSPTPTPTPTPAPVAVAKPTITSNVQPVTSTYFSGTPGSFLTSTAPPYDSPEYQNNYNRVLFSVTASGQNLSYQWYFVNQTGSATAIIGATGPTYTFNMTSTAQAGMYRVVVSNSGGSVSSEATLSYEIFQINFNAISL